MALLVLFWVWVNTRSWSGCRGRPDGNDRPRQRRAGARSSTFSGTPPTGLSRQPARADATPAGGRRARSRRPSGPGRPRPGPSGVQIHDGCHPRLVPDSRCRVRQASVNAARTNHQDTANAAAVSDTARPELMTASTTWSRSRPVDRARRGTWRWIRRTRAGNTWVPRSTSGTWTRGPPRRRRRECRGSAGSVVPSAASRRHRRLGTPMAGRLRQ